MDIFFATVLTEPQALLEVHCLDAAGERVSVLYMTAPQPETQTKITASSRQ